LTLDSVFTWVRLDSKNGTNYQTILAQENVNGNGRPLLSRRANGDVLVCYLGGVETLSQTAIFADTGKWHHVGLTYDGQYVSLYVDGSREAMERRTGESTDGGLRLAHQKDSIDFSVQAPWNGALDDVRVYNYVLTDSNIRSIYQSRFTNGGGIKGHGSSANISKCIIKENVSETNGGGITNVNGRIRNCFIVKNKSKADGGGLANCNGNLINCVIAENTAQNAGAVFGGNGGSITNCTIVNNIAQTSVGGVQDYIGEITNTIIWGNADADELTNLQEAQLKNCSGNVTYSCIQDDTIDDIHYEGIGN
jgi:hypothetical protein